MTGGSRWSDSPSDPPGPWAARGALPMVSATALTASKSPPEAAENPASMTSTCRRASCSAISTFSRASSEMPGDCSPSRRVVSKIVTSRPKRATLSTSVGCPMSLSCAAALRGGGPGAPSWCSSASPSCRGTAPRHQRRTSSRDRAIRIWRACIAPRPASSRSRTGLLTSRMRRVWPGPTAERNLARAPRVRAAPTGPAGARSARPAGPVRLPRTGPFSRGGRLPGTGAPLPRWCTSPGRAGSSHRPGSNAPVRRPR